MSPSDTSGEIDTFSEMRINVIQTVPVNVGKSNLADPVKRPTTKKKVIWADAHPSTPQLLENVRHFYLDETEKGLLLLLLFPHITVKSKYKSINHSNILSL